MGTTRLGFTSEKVGTHSFCTSFAMQLRLAGVRDHIERMKITVFAPFKPLAQKLKY